MLLCADACLICVVGSKSRASTGVAKQNVGKVDVEELSTA